MDKRIQGIIITSEGLVKLDKSGRRRRNWISYYKKKSRKFLKNKCDNCGSNISLTIHHKKRVNNKDGLLVGIFSLEDFLNRIYDSDNCMTLCRLCHDKVHNNKDNLKDETKTN